MAAILTTSILLLLIFVNIILILMLLPALHGIPLSVSGILIYLLPILLWLINIQNSVLPQERLPVCSVLIFLPIDFNAVSPNYFTVINESEKLSISFFRLVTVKRYVPGTEGALIPSPSAIV